MIPWRRYLQALAAAIFSGIVEGGYELISGNVFNRAAYVHAIIVAIMVGIAWAKQHPPDSWDGTDRRQQ